MQAKYIGLAAVWLVLGCGHESAEPGAESMASAGKGDDPGAICPAITNSCSTAMKPYLCDGEEPSYDCAECGCPGEETCFEGVCYDSDVIELEHTTPSMSLALPLDEYFSFVDDYASASAITYDELIDLLDDAMASDRRVNTLLIGESHGSADEQAVGLGLMREMIERGWNLPSIGIEGDTPIIDVEPLAELGASGHAFGGDLTNNTHCADLVPAIANSTNEEAVYVQYSGSGHTSQEACHYSAYWPVCDLPHTSECALRAGRKALTVILFDPEVWMWNTDRLLFWRLPDVTNREAFGAALDENLARWAQSFESQSLAPEFDASVEGRELNVRIAAANHADDVYVAFFPRPERKPHSNMVFRSLWEDEVVQNYIVEHQLHPKKCILSWNFSEQDPVFKLRCRRDDKQLDATLDAESYELLDYDLLDTPS